jgi:RNA polymerase sigma factor (sigma-70 family)
MNPSISQLPSHQLLLRSRDGDEDASREIFERYLARLTALARSRLAPRLTRRTDPEDIVLSAYRSFFVGARDGRFVLQRSGDLWRLLVSITLHKLYRQVKRHSAESRDVQREKILEEAHAFSREPTVDEAVALADELEAILKPLDPLLRRVLELRLQGQSLEEIAAITMRSERTVRRSLAELREAIASRREGDADD